MQQERQEVLTFRVPLPFRLRRRLKQDLARDGHQPDYDLSRRGRGLGHDVERKKKQRTKTEKQWSLRAHHDLVRRGCQPGPGSAAISAAADASAATTLSIATTT